MDFEKIVDIVFEDDAGYIATIWTGANYYIDFFPREDIAAYIAYGRESGENVSVEDAIKNHRVNEMQLLCRNDDFTSELLNDQVQWLWGRLTDVQVADNGVRAVCWSDGENE